MSELLGLSFDGVTAPVISLRGAVSHEGSGTSDGRRGWGFGWYPGSELAGQILKNPTASADDPAARALKDWNRFGSTLFLGHFLGSAAHRTQGDSQPYLRNYSGRAWIIAHSGALREDFRRDLPLGDKPGFEPVGRTDTEHVFCWLLNRMQASGTRSFGDYGWDRLVADLRAVNELGSLNLMLTDGQSLVVYQDREEVQPIYWSRRLPHQDDEVLGNHVLTLDREPHQSNRTVAIFATTPLSNDAWVRMAGGQLLVARRGQVFWDSLNVWDRGDSLQQQTVQRAASGDADIVALFPPARRRRVQPDSPPAPGAGVAESPSIPEVARDWPLRWKRQGPGVDAEHPHRFLNVLHETIYRYERPVEASQHVLRLQPVEDATQTLEDYDLQISVDGQVHRYEDVFGNHNIEMIVSQPFSEFVVRAKSRVGIAYEEGLDARIPHAREQIPLVWMPWQRQMMSAYLLPPELPETHLTQLLDFAKSFADRNDHSLREMLTDMNRTIYRDFKYLPGATTLETTPYEVFDSHQGVCQDFANLLICMARLMNIPARYRVGYVDTHATANNPIQSEASHAWAEFYIPGAGWVGFDPTNGTLVGQEHVRVACGRNYRDATPTTGTLFKGGGGETMEITVKVEHD